MPIAAVTSVAASAVSTCRASHRALAQTTAPNTATTLNRHAGFASARLMSEHSGIYTRVLRLAKVFDSSIPQFTLQVRRVIRAEVDARGSLRSSMFISRSAHVRLRADTSLVSNLDATHTLTGLIAPAFSLFGSITVDNSSVYTPATDFVTAEGTRRTFGVLVYARDVLVPGDTADVPLNRHFLVSALFAGNTGDPLYDVGATADAIGKKVVVRGAETLIFRDPIPGEVVIDVPNRRALRYETDPDTGVASWKDYRTMPQRFVDGMGAVELFDEAGIINFFAMLIGSAMSQWTYENNVLYAQRDADTTVEAFLPYLGLDYGVSIDASDQEAIKRAEVRSAVPVAKLSGTDRSLVLKLLGRGYDATVHEVWINPGHPMAKLTADAPGASRNVAIQYTPGPLLISDANANIILTAGLSGGGDNVAATGYVLFRDGLSPADGDVLTISDGVSSVAFEFDDRSVIATGSYAAGASFGGSLTSAPLVAGSVTLRFESEFSNIVVIDDGVGGWLVDSTGGDFDGITVAGGTVNYVSGAWTITFSAPLAAGMLQTIHTSNAAVIQPGNTPVQVGVDAATTLSNFINAVNASLLAITATDETAANTQGGPFPDQQPGVSYPLANTTSEKGAGTAFITMPHGYRVGLPRPPYFPSSRIALYLAYLDGTPAVDLTEDERTRIAAVLAPILPAYVDIRLIGAKVNVNGPSEEERLVVGETFTVGSYVPPPATVPFHARTSAAATGRATITATVLSLLFARPTMYMAYEVSGAPNSIPATPSFAGGSLVRVSSGRYYAFNQTGRYVAWSDNNMESWTEHDYGANLASDVRVEVVVKDSVETLLLSDTSGVTNTDIRRWGTIATPPVLTATTSGILREAYPVRGFGGEPILVGADSNDNGQIARYTGSWQKATVCAASTGTCTWAVKLASGVYLAACWRFTGNAWIRRSTNFTTWSADINNVTGVANETAARGLIQLSSGRVLWGISRGTGNQPHIWYSDNDGLTWTQATVPTVTNASIMLGFIQDPATGDVFTYISDGTLLRSTNAGASWSVLSSGGTAQSFQPRALGQIRR